MSSVFEKHHAHLVETSRRSLERGVDPEVRAASGVELFEHDGVAENYCHVVAVTL